VISTGQIVAAGAVTAVSVAIAATAVRWPVQWILAAAFGALVLIIAWRAASNLQGLNGDFLPAVSVGDIGCLLVGAIAPLAVGYSRVAPARRRWVPAIAGALVGFVVNVVIL
jgi:cobalamin synthase